GVQPRRSPRKRPVPTGLGVNSANSRVKAVPTFKLPGDASVDGGAAKALSNPKSVTLPPSPQPSASFKAVVNDGSDFNPDTQGAAGPNHLMVTLNSSVLVQDKGGNNLKL